MEKIVKIITSMSGKYAPALIFEDFVKLTAIALSNSTDIIHIKEKEYKQERIRL